MTNLVNSIIKALETLDIIIFEDMTSRGLSLTKLSEKMNIKTNTLHNILRTMIHCGYVEQNDKSYYLAGKRVRQIGIINKFQIDPKTSNILNEELHNLCSKTDESVSFYVLDDGDRINYTNIQSNDIIKVDYTMLEENSIYSYPSGKILVAFCSDEELNKIIKKHGYPKELWNGISNKKELTCEIDIVRKQGYLKKISPDKKVTSYAVAVFSHNQLLGSIGVYMPTFRADKQKEKEIISELKKSAENIKIQMEEQ